MLLEDLVHIQAVSGEETHIFRFLKKYLLTLKIPFRVLPHGDIYVGMEKPKLLITAHVDEVGFTITKINSDGTCHIKDIGWVYPWLFPAREVQVRTTSNKIVQGLVVYDKAFDKNIHTWKQIRVDFGFSSAAGLKSVGITQGCLGTYKKTYWETKEKIFGTALDNRLGVFTLLMAIKNNKHLLKKGIGFAFTSFEEMTNAGAKKTIRHVQPHHLCVVDIMPHSILELASLQKFSSSVGILEKTIDYSLPKAWKPFLKGLHYFSIQGKSPYLKNSEPKIFERMGYPNAINFEIPVLNYHHGAYSCQKKALSSAQKTLQKIITRFAIK